MAAKLIEEKTFPEAQRIQHAWYVFLYLYLY